MAEAEEKGVPGEEQQHRLSSSSGGPEDKPPAVRAEGTQDRPAEGGAAPYQRVDLSVDPTPDQFRLRRFFVLRVKTSTGQQNNSANFNVTSCSFEPFWN